MRFKQQENRAIQQLIFGGLALICAGLLYLATVRQITESQLQGSKAPVAETTTTILTDIEESTSQTTDVTEAMTILVEEVYQPPIVEAPVEEPIYTEEIPVEPPVEEAPVEPSVSDTSESSEE